jgi:hypothetical protein
MIQAFFKYSGIKESAVKVRKIKEFYNYGVEVAGSKVLYVFKY